MIVDDFMEMGLGNEEVMDKAHVVKVPYRLGVRFENIESYEGVGFYVDPLVDKLTPVKKRLDKDYVVLDAEWGKCPYENMILFHSEKERCLITILSIQHEGNEKWFCVLYIKMSMGLVAIPVICMIQDKVLVLARNMGDEDSNIFFFKLAYDITNRISGEVVAKWWVENLSKHLVFTKVEQTVPLICWDVAKVVLVTTSLMNAKNIVSVSNVPDNKLQKARIKRGKKPLVVWHELKLSPFKKIYKEGHISSTGELLPLHWVRGHFKIFSKEKPLFGKYSGRYWWQPHIAGTDYTRVVNKNYKIDVEVT